MDDSLVLLRERRGYCVTPMHHLQNVAQKPITAAPVPATPVTLQKKDVTVGRSQAGGEEKASATIWVRSRNRRRMAGVQAAALRVVVMHRVL